MGDRVAAVYKSVDSHSMTTATTNEPRRSSSLKEKRKTKTAESQTLQTRSARRRKTPWDSYPYESLWVSCVSEQAYCEKRVELWLKDPGDLVSVPRRLEQIDPGAVAQARLAANGKLGHGDLSAGAEAVQTAEILTRLALGQRFWLVESEFPGEFRGFPLLGKPDAICFGDGRAVSIVEYKFTDSNQLQTSHRVQLLIYGYLLEECGIDVKDLILTCALIPRRYMDESLPSDIAEQISGAAAQLVNHQRSRKNWRLLDLPVGNDISVNIRAFRYDRAVAERELEFFAQFWSGERPAIPTRMESKCARCLYNKIKRCSNALVVYESDPGF